MEQHEAELKAKREAAIQEMKITMEENDRFTSIKQEALKLQAEKDEEMMKVIRLSEAQHSGQDRCYFYDDIKLPVLQEMLDMLERQEKERAEALRAFHNRVEARSQSVGQQAIAESQNRKKKEDNLLLKFQV